MAPPTVHPLQLVPKAPKLSGAGAEGHPSPAVSQSGDGAELGRKHQMAKPITCPNCIAPPGNGFLPFSPLVQPSNCMKQAQPPTVTTCSLFPGKQL